MGDMGDAFKAMKDQRKAVLRRYGVLCPRCREVRPKAHPSNLLPQQLCRVDNYRDPRPALTDEQRSNA